MPHINLPLSVRDRILHFVTGAALVMFGAFIAHTVALPAVPAYMVEAAAYVVHACGIAPMLAALVGAE